MEKVSKCRTGSARSKYAAFVRVNKIKHPSLFSCKSHFQLSSTVDVCTPAQHACTSSLRRFSSGPPRSFAGGRYTTGVNGRRFLYSDSMGVHHRGPPVPTVEKHHTKTPSALGSPLSPPPSTRRLRISASISAGWGSSCSGASSPNASILGSVKSRREEEETGVCLSEGVQREGRLCWSLLCDRRGL